MWEPQVDTFCRCVKKVKKTLKARPGSISESGKKERSAAEGRAIAICTKSVLQTKGRTLRKVRCRDKVLETQPMKPQEGGKFRWMGADTPVFNNQAVGEWNGFPVMKVSDPVKFDGWIAKYNPVVRMVSEGDGELPVHKILREMLDKTDPFNQPFVKMHFNLVVNQDAIYEVDYNATLAMVKLQKEDDKTEKLERVGSWKKWFGLVTRTQQSDVVDLDPEPQRDAMCAFLRVLLRIDGRMIHADLHRGNMAIMYDGKPVIHDVGRMKIRFGTDMPGAPQSRFLRNALYSRFDDPNYYMSLSQHFYIARMFKKIRKAYGEDFPKPTAATNWQQNYMRPEPESDRKFIAWLDAKATGANETNYVQVARVYDILSVLKGLSDLPRRTAAGKPAQLTAYYYARKAAVTLTTYLFAGYATKDNVTRVVRSFLALSGTMDQCGGRPKKPGQKYEDPENEYAALYMTPEGGFKDETRGNPSSAPPPPPPPPPAPPAPESVDLSQIGATEKALRAQEDKLNQARIESLSGKGDAEAIETLSAIKDVTTTAREVKTAAKNFGKPPEDKAAAPAAEAEAEEEEAEDDFEVGLEVRTADRSAAAKAELAERLLDARLAQGSSPKEAKEDSEHGAYLGKADGRQEGGVYRSGGTVAITFEAHDDSWVFLPPPTDPAALTAAVQQAIEARHSPSTIVAYISSVPGIKEKHDIVKSSADYAPYAHTYVASYKCNIQALVETPTTEWSRDKEGRMNRTPVVHFPGGWPYSVDKVLVDALYLNPEGAQCLLIPKFQGTVANLAVGGAIGAMLNVLLGLCVPRAFIIDDLHVDNMAVYDGRVVTFDYDRVRTREEFGGLFSKILENPYGYLNLPQYDHVMKLGPLNFGAAAASLTFFVNYDLLSVLSSLKFICSKLTPAAGAAVDTCMTEIATLDATINRTPNIQALGAALSAALAGVNDQPVSPLIQSFASEPNLQTAWKEWRERQRLQGPITRSITQSFGGRGGRRTFRRKGLPRLL